MKEDLNIEIGSAFEGGFYGGQIRIGIAIFAIVWAPKAHGELHGKWLDSYTSVPGACSYFDSMANTKAMADAGSELAKKVLALEIDGINDWCLPARDGDNPSSVPAGYPYTDTLPAQTTVAAFQDGGAECFVEELYWYWSSTQYSDYDAWGQDFSRGHQGFRNKISNSRCRAVRLITNGSISSRAR